MLWYVGVWSIWEIDIHKTRHRLSMLSLAGVQSIQETDTGQKLYITVLVGEMVIEVSLRYPQKTLSLRDDTVVGIVMDVIDDVISFLFLP